MKFHHIYSCNFSANLKLIEVILQVRFKCFLFLFYVFIIMSVTCSTVLCFKIILKYTFIYFVSFRLISLSLFFFCFDYFSRNILVAILSGFFWISVLFWNAESWSESVYSWNFPLLTYILYLWPIYCTNDLLSN